MIPASRFRGGLVLGLGLMLGCTAPVDSPVDPQVPAAAAKAAAGISVTAADPSFGKQGETGKRVRILGAGFAVGDQASWQRGGVADPKVRVQSTEFVSSTELVATISIDADATLALYDIAIIRPGRKGGIGTQLFEVTLATPISGSTEARAVNDNGRVLVLQGDVVRVYDISTGVIQTIGSGNAHAIDQLGSTASGASTAQKAVLWRFANGWSETVPPDLGMGGGARSIVSDATGAAVMIGGFATRSIVVRNKPGFVRNPAIWTRNGSGGWTLTLLEQPIGTHGIVSSINSLGMGAGFDGTGCCYAFYWDAAGRLTQLPALVPGAASVAYAINGDGTLIAGRSSERAVVWRRPTAADSWSSPVPLDVAGCEGAVHGMNGAGVLVGTGCRGATVWIPGPSASYVGKALGSLGKPCNNSCIARAINNLAVPFVVGMIGPNTGQSSSGVYWTGF
jgi:uncharacterized membrane protein